MSLAIPSSERAPGPCRSGARLRPDNSAFGAQGNADQPGFFSAREARAEKGETIVSGSSGDSNVAPGLRG